MAKKPAPGWYPDPFARYEVRYWDGKAWTEHVSTAGTASTDEPVQAQVVPTVKRSAEKIKRDVSKAGAQATTAGGGTLLTEPILVVNQKAKLLELNNEYAVFDQNANQIGAVRQVGQSAGRKVLRALTSIDQFLTHRLEIVDLEGNVVLKLVRPGKIMKSKVLVTDAADQEIGQIVQQNVIGKIRFGLEAGGQPLGSINAENWRAWNFNIQDQTGTEVARITKTGGLRQDHVHHRGQLRGADPSADRGPVAQPGGGRCARRGHRAEAGLPRSRLSREWFFGGPRRTRTCNLGLKRPLL